MQCPLNAIFCAEQEQAPHLGRWISGPSAGICNVLQAVMSEGCVLHHVDLQDKVDIQPLMGAERAGDALD